MVLPPSSGLAGEHYRADLDDLRWFIDRGGALSRSLRALLDQVGWARSRTRALLGDEGPPSAGPACDELVCRMVATEHLARSVGEALAAGGGGGHVPADAGGGVRGLLGRSVTWPVRSGLEPAGEVAALVDRTVRELINPVDDAVLEALSISSALPELSGRAFLGPLYPPVADFINSEVTPLAVMALWRDLDRLVPDDPGNGDPGGTFTTRPTGGRLTETTGSLVDLGRRAVIGALDDTARADVIRSDEFEIIRHGEMTYTIVLAGVVDLSRPERGYHQHHGSVRDTDVVAARSAASASIGDNLYAQLVAESLDRLGVPAGSDLLLVGHSLGADTALDLAADPVFNGDRYRVTHVVAAGYHSEPQLGHVQAHTEVLVLQNNKDVPVLVEGWGHLSSDPFEEFTSAPGRVVLREFDGGWKGAGHHQDNYTSYLTTVDDAEVEDLLAGITAAGYGGSGRAVSVDISNPGVGSGSW